MTHLWSLNLAGTRVGDSGLRHLEGLAELQHLDLSGTGVTDRSLDHLKGMANLQALDLSGTKVTDAGLRTIRGLLPEATVIRGAETREPASGQHTSPGEPES